jgi:uncharacterized protein involved in exopolysaccharide biosynthesis
MVLHSVRRHPWIFFGVWLVVVALTAAALAVMPRTYDVQTTLQVSRAGPIAALTNPKAPRELDAPTRAAAETVLRHENLVALVQQTKLLERWNLHRAPALRLKDAVRARLFPPPTAEQRLEAFVGLLEDRLWVDTESETLSIGIHFPDPDLAYDLVQAALKNFLDARRDAEISSIEDAIEILEARSTEAHAMVETALKEMADARASRSARLGLRPRRTVPASMDQPLDKAGSQLIAQVQAKRQAITQLEDLRRRRMLELQTRLREQRATYSDNHPVVLDLQQNIAALNQEPAELQTLRRDLAALEKELRSRGLLADVPLGAPRARSMAEAAALEPLDPREEEDPDVAYTKAQVRHALTRYNGLLDRIDAARLELDTAQAAFKHRYVLIRPPQRPNAPARPNVGLVLLASVVAGFFLALFAPSLLDLASRKLIEPWQIEQALGVPVLGEVSER